jgi:MFS family permease
MGFYGPPVYLANVVARTGWSVGLVSAAVTVHFLVGALVIARLPRLYARVGLALVTTIGAAITAVGVAGWAVAAHPWQLFATALLSGAGWVTMGAMPVNIIVSRWYVAGRPAALARAYNGATIGGVVFTPLWAALIGAWGFAEAATAIGTATVILVAWLSRTILRKTPGSVWQRPDGAPASPVSPPPRTVLTRHAGRRRVGRFGATAHSSPSRRAWPPACSPRSACSRTCSIS